jgi:predicted DNA-binding transcriptional regulator AlpA
MGRLSDISLWRLVMQFTIPEIGFVRLPEVLMVIPVGKTCWWEGVKSGRYPKAVKISPHCTAWRAEDIRNLIKQIEAQNPIS